MSHEASNGNPSKGTDAQGDDFSPDGVDLTLIRWMLSLSPAERLRVLQDHVNSIMRLRRGQPGH